MLTTPPSWASSPRTARNTFLLFQPPVLGGLSGHRAKRREEAASYMLVEANISFGGGSGEGSGT